MIEGLRQQLEAVPVIPFNTWLRLGLMFCYCITGEQLNTNDFEYAPQKQNKDIRSEKADTYAPKNGVWLAEQEAMRVIEEGRLDYLGALDKLGSFESTYPMGGSLPFGRSSKNGVISMITLATRAAIRGGVEPETAYYIGMRYIENVEETESLAELLQVNSNMLDDFIRRVHKVRESGNTSAAIRTCCDYIDMHLAENLTARTLAARAGYSEFYIAKKFKNDMGMSIAQYIKQVRVERAKLLLRSTNKSIQDIADELGFCNHSYFTSSFRSVIGMTPGEYRNKI